MISDTVSDIELISRLPERDCDDGLSCRPEVIVSISFLSEIPLSFGLSFKLGQGYRASQLVYALVLG